MFAYRIQVEKIQAAWPELERFYGNHIIHMATLSSTDLAFAEIASTIFPEVDR